MPRNFASGPSYIGYYSADSRDRGAWPCITGAGVRTPTIAFFGALDRNVNFGYSAPAFRRYFKSAGMHDFTERIYPNAGHSLEISETGYYDQPSLPRRLVPYLPTTIQWLRARHFAN